MQFTVQKKKNAIPPTTSLLSVQLLCHSALMNISPPIIQIKMDHASQLTLAVKGRGGKNEAKISLIGLLPS